MSTPQEEQREPEATECQTPHDHSEDWFWDLWEEN